MLQSTRRSAWRRSALLIVAAVLVMTVMTACGNKGSNGHSLEFKGVSGGEVVATYKDGKVTKPEFDKYLALYALNQPDYEAILSIPQFQEMILEQYIAFKVLGSKATGDTLKQANKDVYEQLKAYKDYKKSNKDFEAKAKEKKITDADMATYMMLTAATVAHVNSLVTDEDIAAAFKELEADFAVSNVRHILVATKETNQETGEQKELRTLEEALKRAEEVKAKLDAGGDWDELAKQYSDDPGSKDKGGLYEGYPGGQWVEPFKMATFEQEIGVVGPPVETDFGYHIIKVESRDVKTYDQLSDAEKEQVKNAAAYKYMETFMAEEMPNQDVKITLPEPEQPAESETPAGEGDTDTEAPAETPAGDNASK